MNATDAADTDIPELTAEEVQKKVSPATPSGVNFMPWDATAKNLNKLTLLKFLLSIQNTCALL
jgi:hypothetical protein